MTIVARPDIIENIGNTPLKEVASFSSGNIKFFAKLEWYNPFGSIKDRVHIG